MRQRPLHTWHLGELEDVRPCDGCGRDYVFLIGSDPGYCGQCLHFHQNIADSERLLRRERRARRKVG